MTARWGLQHQVSIWSPQLLHVGPIQPVQQFISLQFFLIATVLILVSTSLLRALFFCMLGGIMPDTALASGDLTFLLGVITLITVPILDRIPLARAFLLFMPGGITPATALRAALRLALTTTGVLVSICLCGIFLCVALRIERWRVKCSFDFHFLGGGTPGWCHCVRKSTERGTSGWILGGVTPAAASRGPPLLVFRWI